MNINMKLSNGIGEEIIILKRRKKKKKEEKETERLVSEFRKQELICSVSSSIIGPQTRACDLEGS